MPVLPKITVVTPTFNSRHTLRETLESVRSQNYPHLEHLVMDGGSTDGTLDILKHFPHVTWVSEKDEGHYHAMNKGILRATGEIVNVLNSDDCFRPGALQAVGSAFAEHPEWEALFGDVVYVDADSREIFSRQEAKWDYDVLRFGTVYVIHPTLFVRKSVHDRIGVFRHKEFLNCCDYDFLLRMGRANCQIGHLRQFLVNYRFHEHGQSADRRIINNTRREANLLRREHGLPGGLLGWMCHSWFRLVRQGQKLRYLGRCDLVPGLVILRKHMREKTQFSSNIGLDKL